MNSKIILILLVAFFSSFHIKAQTKKPVSKSAKSAPVKETLNFTDSIGQKQGLWKIDNTIVQNPEYSENAVVEEGRFVNNKKEGLWIAYFSNGKKKSEIVYKNNIPNGRVKFYYPNGNVLEEGTWINSRWEGKYKYYYENGQISYDWNFLNGRREGVQKYFSETGELKYSGIWKNGLEEDKSSDKK